MHILLINPNVTQAMTEQVATRIRHCAPGVSLECLTAERGVSVIASRASFAVAEYSTLQAWTRRSSQPQAVLVACFGDPAVEALRELSNVPVYGLAEASLRHSAGRYARFAVVTAGPAWKSMLDELARRLPLNGRYLGTYAIDATGLDAAGKPQAFINLLQQAIDNACRDGAKAIILGGAALAGMKDLFRADVPLLDCVETAMQAIQAGDYPYPAPQPAVAISSQGLDKTLAGVLNRHA